MCEAYIVRVACALKGQTTHRKVINHSVFHEFSLCWSKTITQPYNGIFFHIGFFNTFLTRLCIHIYTHLHVCKTYVRRTSLNVTEIWKALVSFRKVLIEDEAVLSNKNTQNVYQYKRAAVKRFWFCYCGFDVSRLVSSCCCLRPWKKQHIFSLIYERYSRTDG